MDVWKQLNHPSPSSIIQGAPGVGITKPISSIALFSNFFQHFETTFSYLISRLYLTGVAAAQP